MRITPANNFKVLITGFGPYSDGLGGHIDVNTSFVVTTTLPKMLHPNTASNPFNAPIDIITLPHPVKTEYRDARNACKTIHDKHADDIDLFVHLGEARANDFVTVERVAYKEGMSSVWWTKDDEKGYYTMPDEAGQTITDLAPSPWDKLPMGLRTALNVDAVVEGATKILVTNSHFNSSNIKVSEFRRVQASPEGGPFLCGFINYESLANRYSRGLVPNVLFCHVPGEADEENLTKTRDALLAVIVSAINEVSKQRK